MKWYWWLLVAVFVILGISTLVPAPAGKPCLLGYYAHCSFTPISTLICWAIAAASYWQGKKENAKIIKLGKLENDIRRKFGDLYWLFKPRGKVKGFYGTGFCEKYNKNVMFVAERPSKVGFKEEKQFDRPLQLFYETLESFNFENAHVTDFIKTKAKAGERNDEDLKDSIEIFDREFEIIKPEIVIGVGNTAFHWLYFYLLMKKKNLKPYKLMHYSQRKPVNSYRESFRESLKKIAEDILKADEPKRSAD